MTDIDRRHLIGALAGALKGTEALAGFDSGVDRARVTAAEYAQVGDANFEGDEIDAAQGADKVVGLEVADVAVEADREVHVLHLDPLGTGQMTSHQRELGAHDLGNLDGSEQARHRLRILSDPRGNGRGGIRLFLHGACVQGTLLFYACDELFGSRQDPVDDHIHAASVGMDAVV